MTTPNPQPFPNTYPCTPRDKYPHMQPNDALLWNQFLKAYADPNVQVAYDVHLGTIPHTSDDDPLWLKKYLAANYPKKADVLIFLPRHTLVVEIKPYAGLTALGQALGYAALFQQQYPTHPRVTPAILTDNPQPDMPYLCRLYRIALLTLPQQSPS